MVQMLRAISRSILDFCLPRECPACRTPHESTGMFCHDCDNEIQKLNDGPRCGHCAMPVTLVDAPCAHCLGKGLSPFEKIACLGVLKDSLKSIVHRAKYEHRWPLAEHLADRLVSRSDVQSMLVDIDVIVPVPLHIKRQRQRGYNQAEVIARRASHMHRQFDSPARKGGDRSENDVASPRDPRPSGLGYQRKLTVKNAAVRVLNTESQTHLPSRAKRMENLSGAFVLIDPDAIAGRNILLVDDVLTTGATLVSLARTLQVAKPARLSAIVVAVADPKGRHFEVI
jgi:predicted amidophosphoribosyltransferase